MVIPTLLQTIPTLSKNLKTVTERLWCAINEAKDDYARSAAETEMLKAVILRLEQCKSVKMRILIDALSGKTTQQIGQILASAERQEAPNNKWSEFQRTSFDWYVSEYRILRETKEALRVSAESTEKARLRLIYAEDALTQHMRRLQEVSCLPTDHAKNFHQ